MQWQWLKQADDYLNSIKTYANTVDLLDIAEMLIIAFLV